MSFESLGLRTELLRAISSGLYYVSHRPGRRRRDCSFSGQPGREAAAARHRKAAHLRYPPSDIGGISAGSGETECADKGTQAGSSTAQEHETVGKTGESFDSGHDSPTGKTGGRAPRPQDRAPREQVQVK